MSVIANRLEKNLKKLAPWAKRAGISAYRLYDRDIPEYPVIIDIYNDFYVVYDKSNPHIERDQVHFKETVEQLSAKLKVPESKLIIKKRFQRDNKTEQYVKLDSKNDFIVVQEGNLRFKVNLWDYLDTGLFLDHRPIRYQLTKGKHQGRLLNLFCYTGSISVAAAKAGMETYNVDMSRTYIDWAQENFLANELDPADHEFVQEDALQFLANPGMCGEFDMIFLDPPTFSNSKRMEGDFDVERDQVKLVQQAAKLLKSSGVLYFSNNKRKFRLDSALSKEFKIKDISADTIPQDFHDQKIHHCFEIRKL